MAHKTMVGGTAYSIVGGRSMVSGTTYDVVGGRTMVDGTTYDISFAREDAYALLYNSYRTLRFQRGNEAPAGETVLRTISGIENTTYTNTNAPWNSYRANISSVIFADKIYPISLNYWFNNVPKITELDTSKISFKYVTGMIDAFRNCKNLTGNPVCGDNVVYFNSCYHTCYNLTGEPVCGNNVQRMDFTYYDCRNLTGSPACSENVTNLHRTYFNCRNLTGHPVCGNKVMDMYGAYHSCINMGIEGRCVVLGSNVTNACNAFYNCSHITGNVYLYSPNIRDMNTCFWCNSNNSVRNDYFNIFLPANSTTSNTVINNGYTRVLNGIVVCTNEGAGSLNGVSFTRYSNHTKKLYLYAVENVAAARAANGD